MDKEAVQLYENDVLLFGADQECILQKCCGCGLWHKILIDGHENDLRIEFARVDGEPDPDNYDVRTDVEDNSTGEE